MISERAKKELDKLLQGNRNFVNGTPTAKNMCIETLKKYAYHQEPYACVLTCSDSRVVPEIIFDCGIGELFVVRVAGMTTGPNVIESIEYAVKKLNVPLVILLGHDDCGVMKAAKSLYPKEPEHLQLLIRSVYEIIDDEAECYNEIARNYTLTKKRKLLKRSEILRKAHHEKKFEIVRAYLKFDTGEVVVVND